MVISAWHGLLDMPKYDKAWHIQDLADELEEYNQETKLFKRWSELSDVVYTCTRGQWSGHDIEFPFSKKQLLIGSVYMFPKISARYMFFRRAGKKANSKSPLKEVRNPKKTHKLHFIAEKYDLDKQNFQSICEKQLKYWPLLP